MLTQQIMAGLRYERGLSTQPRCTDIRKIAGTSSSAPINMVAAMAEGKEVILWHTSTGSEYIGYRLLVNNDDATNVAFGVPELCYDRPETVHAISQFHFVECEGIIAPAIAVWPMAAIYWLAAGDVGHYWVRVQIAKKDKDECRG